MAHDTTPESSTEPTTEPPGSPATEPTPTGSPPGGGLPDSGAVRRAVAPAGAPPPVERPAVPPAPPVDVVRDAMAELERSLEVPDPAPVSAGAATPGTVDPDPDDVLDDEVDETEDDDVIDDEVDETEDEVAETGDDVGETGTEADDEVDSAAPDRPTVPDDGGPADGPTGEAAADAGPSDDAGDLIDDDLAGSSALLPAAMSVLFQPPSASRSPDSTGRRSRRAVAPAGPAQAALFAPPAEREEPASDSPPAGRPAGDADSGDPGEDGAEDADAAGSPGDADGDADESGDEAVERRRRRRGGRGRRRRRPADGEAGDAEGSRPDDQTTDDEAGAADDEAETAETTQPDTDSAGERASEDDSLSRSARRRRRRRRRAGGPDESDGGDAGRSTSADDVTSVRGSTRLEAKRQRRREGRDSTRRRTVITEAEFLARRESVERSLLVREKAGRTQVAVLEDGVLVEHYVSLASNQSMIGNVYLGKVQNVLPSMEAAFVDIGRGRNAVLYAGEVNWDAVGITSKQDRRIEAALKPGDPVLVQVTKDPVGHKGARLTAQVSLPGRFLVLVPGGSMTGISRKLPDTERSRLKRVLKRVLPEDAGVIVRTAAEGAAEEDLERDVARLVAQWEDISRKSSSVSPPSLLYAEPDLAIRVVRDVFNEDIASLVVAGDDIADTLEAYVGHIAPDLAARLTRWRPEPDGVDDLFAAHRVDEQIAKALERKVWLPSGGSLVVDRTEAMTVIDVNTGKFTGAGGDLEETVTRNNLEAAEEIVRQLRLRDLGGIIVVDFIDMVLESNRQLVLRRLVECLGRDRTKHQVAEVTSLGLVQMTRKRVGQGLLEAFSTTCETCGGRGVMLHDQPVEGRSGADNGGSSGRDRGRRGGPRVDQPA